jgi:hypothetical protein
MRLLVLLVAAILMLGGRNGKLLGSDYSTNMAARIGGHYVYAAVLLGVLRVTGGYGWPQDVGRDGDMCTWILVR